MDSQSRSRRPQQALSRTEQIIEQLASATAAMRRVLASCTSEETTHPIGLREVNAAFTQVKHIRELLENTPEDSSAELETAFSDYRRTLLQLRSHMLRLQGWLLAERARLGNRRDHSASVETWLETHGRTR